MRSSSLFEALQSLRLARRLLTQGGAHIPAAHVQLAIDLIKGEAVRRSGGMTGGVIANDGSAGHNEYTELVRKISER